MKISEKTIVAYLWADHHRTVIDPKSGASDKPLSVALADALQQAVAESLKANAWMAWLLNDKKGPSPSLMGDWLAEADKLLRGEK